MSLILFFGDRLGLAFAPDHDLASFSADGVRYENTGAGGITSLYDRLIDADDKLIGVQLWCFPVDIGLNDRIAALGPRPYLDASIARSTGSYGVFFSGDVDHTAASTGDQAFGGEIFRGPAGELAISIDLNYLCGGHNEAADLAAIRAAPVWWPQLANVVERVGA